MVRRSGVMKRTSATPALGSRAVCRPWPRATHDRAAPRREIQLPPTSTLNNIVVTLNAVLSQAHHLYVKWIVFIYRKWMVTKTRLIWRGEDELEERRLRSPKVGALWNQDEAAHELVNFGLVVGQEFQEAHSFITSAFPKFASGCPQPKYVPISGRRFTLSYLNSTILFVW